jgi:hypothetical protein
LDDIFSFHFFYLHLRNNQNPFSMKLNKPTAYLAPDLRRLSCCAERGFTLSIATDGDSSTEQLEWD